MSEKSASTICGVSERAFTRRQALARLAALSLTLLTAACVSDVHTASAAPTPDTMPNLLTLWYDHPAQSAMNEALPIGEGRLGAVVFGGTAHERLAFNVDSLWTGDANPSGEYETPGMGAYQAFGDLLIEQPSHEAATDYRRTLDLGDALAGVRYRVGDVTYTREYFACAPYSSIVIRLTADRHNRCTGVLRLRDAHNTTPVAKGSQITFSGKLENDLLYAAHLTATAQGGKLVASADGSLAFTGCDTLTIVLSAATNYVMQSLLRYRQKFGDIADIVAAQADAAVRKSYPALRDAHVRDHRRLFDRTALDLGKSPADRYALPTDKRKELAANGDDPELEALMFQYGRYLLIGCSRPGTLPANLQGLWNDSNSPPWHCDYHANINIQMNYWPAEPAGLSECHVPFFDLVCSQLPDWRTATQAAPEYRLADGKTVRGWALRTSHNITGGMGWNWDKTANAWYCRHFYEHWAFTGDRTFLQDVAYPVLRETCEFWEDHLKALPDGRLVVPQGWSPEHGPVEDGVTYNQEIVWDLFTNYVEAATVLGIDADYRIRIAAMRDKLVAPQIGHWGQLQEWMTDRDDPNDHHRHTSHLYAVYPGRQIGVESTPALAKAAATSLLARGDTGDVREWSFAWRTALWARLGDGERAHGQFRQIFSSRNSCPNLFGLHPPMQMDGNFGITAGVAEMLLQSHELAPDGLREIYLLPALPAAWTAGHATGLCARSGITVDQAWADGKLTQATLRSTASVTCRVRYGKGIHTITLKAGKATNLHATDFV